MAKESMKARERKRAEMVAKYAAKRKALKEAGLDTEWIHLVPVDFNHEFWLEKLTHKSFNA